jgi:hypothetical protein
MSSVFKYFSSCEEAFKNGYGDREGFKCCSYCGSMDPVELAELIEKGEAVMEGSDWKYGWPHKFYVEVKNPYPYKVVRMGSRCYTDENGERHEDNDYGPQGPWLHFKFYSNHLALIDDETFEKIAPIISQACGIKWEKKDGELYYTAPHFNYQKSRF